MVMYLFTAYIPIGFMAVENSFLVGMRSDVSL